MEDLKTLKQRHTTPVRKAQRGQIQGKQEGMLASLVCARVEELICGGESVKICGFWFGTSEQHVGDILRAGVVSPIQVVGAEDSCPIENG